MREAYTKSQDSNLVQERTSEGGHPSPATSAGRVVVSVVLMMPSCPLPLAPQHLTPPPLTIAHVCIDPRAMVTAETPGGKKNEQRLVC